MTMRASASVTTTGCAMFSKIACAMRPSSAYRLAQRRDIAKLTPPPPDQHGRAPPPGGGCSYATTAAPHRLGADPRSRGPQTSLAPRRTAPGAATCRGQHRPRRSKCPCRRTRAGPAHDSAFRQECARPPRSSFCALPSGPSTTTPSAMTASTARNCASLLASSSAASRRRCRARDK